MSSPPPPLDLRQLLQGNPKCRSQGCENNARWKCVIVMPAPPMKIGTTDGDRERIFSGVVICDGHRAAATVEQVLGPIGYQALTFAFRAQGKRAPTMGDMAVDFESIDFSRLDERVKLH